MHVLVIDIGGSHVKLAVSGTTLRHQFDSHRELTPAAAVDAIQALNWTFDVVSIGYPGRVGPRGPLAEPGNLGTGWVDFDFARAFNRPVRVINDAAMQALGAYEGARMLFLGLGTGLGSTLVTERVLVPLELGDLPGTQGGPLSGQLGREGLERHGHEAWNRTVLEIVPILKRAFLADYVVLGGGNAGRVEPLPADTRRGGNDDALTGGDRLWRELVEPHEQRPSPFWRVVE
ncbi:MAG: ROK family protein [Vicinamibacterales bacterium]